MATNAVAAFKTDGSTIATALLRLAVAGWLGPGMWRGDRGAAWTFVGLQAPTASGGLLVFILALRTRNPLDAQYVVLFGIHVLYASIAVPLLVLSLRR